MTDRIPLTKPVLGSEEGDLVREVLNSGYLVSGPRTAAFEEGLAARIGVAHVVAVNSGTTAIHLLLEAMGIGPGDEVVVPDFCFPSVAASVLHAGAECVLCDVDADSFNLDVARAERALTSRTKAILAVHQFGIPCGAERLKSLGVHVLEDAACALGAIDDGGNCGSVGVAGCHSFHPRKIITTAEGGAISTNDGALADRLRRRRNHGMARGPRGVDFVELGRPGRLSDVHAAIGVAQLARLDDLIAGRRRAALSYRPRLAAIEGVIAPDQLWVDGRVYQGLVVRIASRFDRDRVVAKLRDRGIESTIGTYAIHQQGVFAARCSVAPGGLEGSVTAAAQSLTLPLWPDMPEALVARVTENLAEVLR